MALYIISAKGPKRKIIAIPLILQKDSSFYLFIYIYFRILQGTECRNTNVAPEKKRKKHLAKIKPY